MGYKKNSESKITKSNGSISRRKFIKKTGAGASAALAASWMGTAPNIVSAANQTLNVLTLGGGIFGAPFTKLKPNFEKAHPGIKINNITMGYSEAIKKYTLAFASGSSTYDVVQIDYIFCAGFAKAGHLVPLDNLLGNRWLKDFYSDTAEGVWAGYMYEGNIYGLPTIGNSQRFIYNKQIAQNENARFPSTWDDLISACKTVTNPGKNQYGFAAGLERLVKAAGIWLPIFWSNGGELFDDRMYPLVNTNQGVEALEILLELIGYMPPGGASYTETDEVKAMGSGLATYDPFAWIPDPIINPTVPRVGNQLDTIVQCKGSVRSAPVMGGLGLVLPKYTNKKEAALEYIKWYNDKDVQKNLLIQEGGGQKFSYS